MINVVYACNDAYVRQTIVSMVSVVKHNQEVKIYLIADNISEANKQMVRHQLERYGQVVHIVDIETVLPGELHLNEEDRHPRTIYAKLFLDHIVIEKRVLYLDSDVLVEGSLKPLFERNMKHELVAGVLMPYSQKVKAGINAPIRQPYICDGVVLFNMEFWRNEYKLKECVDYIDSYDGNPPMLSEGTLNHICENMIGVLEPRYNLMPSMLMYTLKQMRQLFKADYYYRDEVSMEAAKMNPVCIHFMNELYNRPWIEPCDHPMKAKYRDLEFEILDDNRYEEQKVSMHTQFTKWLFRILPFPFFCILYHMKNQL